MSLKKLLTVFLSLVLALALTAEARVKQAEVPAKPKKSRAQNTP